VIGAIVGDLVGSTYEANNVRDKDFPLFTSMSHITDDSIMTLAVADIIQKGYINDEDAIIDTFKEWAIAYPDRGYGHEFGHWAFSSDREPYYSCGNGAAMRISPVGWYARSIQDVKKWSRRITKVTHNHPDAFKASEVVASCIYYARRGKSKAFLKEYIEKYYDIDFEYEDLVLENEFDCTCEGSVPQALYCFIISTSFLDCLKTAISIGGDSDTIACIACSIAEAYYKHINHNIIKEMFENIPEGDPNPLDVIYQFQSDLEYDYVTSEKLTDSHYILFVYEKGQSFYGYSKWLIVLKDHIIERLIKAGYGRINWARRVLKEASSFNELEDIMAQINSVITDYDLSFTLYLNKEKAGI